MPEPRNWADLPAELVHLVSKKLPDRLYVLRLQAVCKNWRSTVSLSDHPPPQLPWLIECNSVRRLSLFQPNLRFYSLAGGDAGTICVPECYRGMRYYGPCHGYLLVSSWKDDIFLLNPLSGDVISLPKLDDELMVVSPAWSDLNPIHNLHVSCDCLASEIEGSTSAIYQADQNGWAYVNIEFGDISCRTCCWDGKLYVSEGGQSTEVFDLVTGDMLYEVPPPEDENSSFPSTYLIESCGEILRVSLYFVTDGLAYHVFNIYKLNSGVEEHSWVKVSDIGDQILFLDLLNGFSMQAPAGFDGNCIYFFHFGRRPCRYNIDTKIVERIPCPFEFCTWFSPNFR